MSERTEAPAGWRALRESGQLPVFAALCLGIWLHAASSLLAATTLPRAVEEIGGAPLISWAFSLYQLGSILAGAATGLFVARFGLRRALLAAGALFGLGSAVAALAPDMAVLLAGRLLQGLGGGWLLALSYVALERLFPNHLMPRLIAVFSGIWSVSAFCGPLIGGSFATFGLWRLAFCAFALQAIVFLAAVLRLVGREDAGTPAPASALPVGRLAALAGAILLISAAGAELRPVGSPLMAVAGLVLFWVFLRSDRGQGAAAMLPHRPFDARQTLGAGLLLVITLSAATMSFLVYGPFLLDLLYGVTPLAAGYIVALESVGWGLASIAVSGVGPAGERHLIRLGAALVTAGILGFAGFMPTGPLWAIVLSAAVQGAGFGMMFPFIVRRIVAAASRDQRDRASSAVPTLQQIGFAFGAAAAGIVANTAGFAEGASPEAAHAVGFWVFAAFLPLALIGNYAAWRLASRPR